MTSTTSTATGRDGLPEKIRDQAAGMLADHRARTAGYRDVLLRPGGPNLETTNYSDGSRRRAPAAIEALGSIATWWGAAITLAEQLTALDREHAAALAALAGAELSEVLRARTIVLGEIAADIVGVQLAAAPPIEDDGTVLVAGARIPLTGAVAAGPPPQPAEVNLSISAGAAVSDVVAKIRSIADQIEKAGSYS